MKRIAITGMGAYTPIGKNIESFFTSIKNGVNGGAPITHFDTSKHKTKFACEIKDHDPLAYFDRREVRKMDLFGQFAMIAADEAIASSGINQKINKARTAVVWGSGIGGMPDIEQQVTEFVSGDGTPRFSPFFITNIIPNIASALISIKYGFTGPNFAPVSACTSSAHAIILGIMLIQIGHADVVVTGGSESPITASSIGGFNTIKALSTRNDSPQTASRPFDKTRDGFVLGEGAGALILEDYDTAVKRGATIHAEIIGYGMTADAYHVTAPHPDGDGALTCMQQAINMAGLNPEEIELYNTHATSTQIGDISELNAMIRFLNGAKTRPFVCAPKSMTGHLLGGAGAVEALVSILAVKENIIPPITNTTLIEESLPEHFQVQLNSSKISEVNYSLSNNFGFGGHNASIIFKKHN